MTIKEFDKIAVIGKGSYSRVILVKHKSTGKLCAIKVIKRELLRKENKEHQFKAEKEILKVVNHPNIIKLLYDFVSKKNIYFGLEYAPNRELSTLLRIAKTLSFSLAQYYTAQIVSALEYLHSLHIAHRDLKPENLLLDENFKIKLTDFGTARFMDRESPASSIKRDTKATFVGTPEYVSPEVLLDVESGMSSDLWALGCIVFKFFTGSGPFRCQSNYLLFESIINKDAAYPKDMPEKAVNLCKKLLIKEPSKRLGAGAKGTPLGMDRLKKDEFFEGIDFDKLEEIKVPITPELIKELKDKEGKNQVVGETISSDEQVEEPISNNTKVEKDYSDEYVKVDSTMVDEKKKDKHKVIKEGIVQKKAGWLFYKKRNLILTNRPRLYYEVPKGEYRGDILLSTKVTVEKASNVKFIVKTPHREYNFQAANEKAADEWIEAIRSIIKKCCH